MAALNHPTVKGVHANVVGAHAVSEATVRRILQKLVKWGLIQVRYTAQGQRFQIGPMPQPTLFCTEPGCQTAIDLAIDNMGALYLPTNNGREPVNLLIGHAGFVPERFQFDIHGTCKLHRKDLVEDRVARSNPHTWMDSLDLSWERNDNVRFHPRYAGADGDLIEIRERLIETAIEEGWFGAHRTKRFYKDYLAIHEESKTYENFSGTEFVPVPSIATGRDSKGNYTFANDPRFGNPKPIPRHWRQHATVSQDSTQRKPMRDPSAVTGHLHEIYATRGQTAPIIEATDKDSIKSSPG